MADQEKARASHSHKGRHYVIERHVNQSLAQFSYFYCNSGVPHPLCPKRTQLCHCTLTKIYPFDHTTWNMPCVQETVTNKINYKKF